MAKKGYIGAGNFVLRDLPKGYTQIEYIQSSGTQYIDTGFKHNQDTRIVMDAQVVSQPSTHAWLFEGRISNVSAAKSIFLLNGNVWNSDYSSVSNRYAFSSLKILDRLKIDFNKNSLTINEYNKTWTTLSFQSTYNLTLLAANTGGTISGYISAKLYSCKIYDNDILIRDFVPCLDSSQNACLYDIINNQCYYNAGSGVFIAGPTYQKDKPQKIEKCYIGINGIAKTVTKAYIGNENNKAQLWFNYIKTVSWSKGTDEQIVKMVAAADAGEINLGDFWSVGDERSLTLPAISATNVRETHAEQTVTLVLLNKGGKTLVNGKTCSFIVGLKDCLNEAGYMHWVRNSSLSWEGSNRRAWCNDEFKTAMFSTGIGAIFKQHYNITATTYKGTGLTTSTDWFALPAAKEVFGDMTIKGSPISAENNALTQFSYYTNSNCRIKKANGSNNVSWWMRSLCSLDSGKFWCMTADGGGWGDADDTYLGPYISPFGCI